jgi:hypothetical protein
VSPQDIDGRSSATSRRISANRGTLELLICEYRKSASFQDLAPQTQFDYLKVLNYLRPIADTALAR